MNQRWLQMAMRSAQSPQGRRAVELALNRARTAMAGSGRGGQLLRNLDTPATRQRLERLLRRGGGR